MKRSRSTNVTKKQTVVVNVPPIQESLPVYLENVPISSSASSVPIPTVRTFRQVDLSRLRTPISLPRWSRQRYRTSGEPPSVPQLAPEIRLVTPDEFIYCDSNAEDLPDDDTDSQVDVVALEETESTDNESPRAIPSKRVRQSVEVKEEPANRTDDDDTFIKPKVDKCRILRKQSSSIVNRRDVRKNASTTKEGSVVIQYNQLMEEGVNDLIQEEVEVVDHSPSLEFYHDVGVGHRRNLTYVDRYSISVVDLYDEMHRHESQNTVESLNEIFVNDPSISYPINVKSLVAQVERATPVQNSKMIAGLAMQINSLKREVQKLHADIVDTRSASLLRQNYGLTGRMFDLNGDVSQHWFIPEQPPLNSVDLVKVARDLGARMGKRNIRNRDVITRYIRAVFDQLIPSHRVREFTVRDRPNNRGRVLDIGQPIKDQITGSVLDLLGLYDAEMLTGNARIDRANFADFVNQAMKTVMYDLRRISPKSRRHQPSFQSGYESGDGESLNVS